MTKKSAAQLHCVPAAENGSEGISHSAEATNSPTVVIPERSRETDADSCPSYQSASLTGWSHNLLVNTQEKQANL